MSRPGVFKRKRGTLQELDGHEFPDSYISGVSLSWRFYETDTGVELSSDQFY